MKRVNNLYKKICDIDVIMDMYDHAIKINTKNKKKIQEFDNFYSSNIMKIKEILMSKDYVPGRYNLFLIHEPKIRIIMSQQIEDKVINHLIAKYFLIDVFDKSMLTKNCATRIGKGTHYALKLFKKDYNYYLNKHDKFYILKLDISKYFYNLDHKIIKELIMRKIKDKDVLKILDSVIDSTDEEYINETIIKLKENEMKKFKDKNNNSLSKSREIENIPLYSKGKGLCIGNMISQVVATFYLDELDKYVINNLKVKAYTRYMDDFYCMHSSKEYLKGCLIKIEQFLKKYKLELNRKTKIYHSNESVEFLGFMFSSKNNNIRMRLTNKTKKKFKVKMKIKNNQYLNKEIEFDEYRSIRDSYRGHLNYGNCEHLYKKHIIK